MPGCRTAVSELPVPRSICLIWLSIDMLQDIQRPPLARDQLVRIVICIVSLLISAASSLLEALYTADPVPYHTSALSGSAWVMELLLGHPERIRCELGMRIVFPSPVSRTLKRPQLDRTRPQKTGPRLRSIQILDVEGCGCLQSG